MNETLPAVTILLSCLAACGTMPAAAPEKEPALFEPGAVSDGGVFGLTLSPEGAHALWVDSDGGRERLTIMESFKKNGRWQAPAVAPFSGSPDWKDIDPAFSPDGSQLIFQSNRPVPGKPERKGFDIWSVKRGAGGWGQPAHLGNVINTDESESSASIAASGNIYFHKAPGGQSDLWVSRLVDGAYEAPEDLGAPVNTAAERESNPYIAPDESYLIYFSTVPGSGDSVDLYISFRAGRGWSTPRRIDAPINSAASEFTAWMHDGRLYFTRQVKQGERFIEDIYSYPFDPLAYETR